MKENMKEIRKNRFGWKSMTFLIALISLFSCTSCDTVSIKSQVTISNAENVTTTSATVVAYVVPNGDATVSFQYQANNSAWVTKSLPSKFSGSDKVKVTLDLYDLQPSTLYNFTVTSVNAAGSVTSSVSSFTTGGLTLAVIKIKSAENVKISAASLKASVIPNQDNTSITFEYQTANSTWQTQTLGTTFSGTDSVKVNFDLSSLQANTLYNFRVRVSNKAGEVVSAITSFTTYAVSDYDGNFYHTVTISGIAGTQTWLKENLKTTHYANGDVIPKVSDLAVWGNLSTGAYCNYNNSDSLANIYGHLYNWYVGTDPRGLIVGWHTPTGNDGVILRINLGDYYSAGPALMETGHVHWLDTSRPATNSSGFTALPNGSVYSQSKNSGYHFTDLKITTCLWTSDLFNSFGTPILIDRSNCYMNIDGLYFLNSGYGLRLINDK
jgi:uncharacterized protein (TIGR02145 family)